MTTPINPSTPKLWGKKRNILIVDDDDDLVRVLKNAFESKGATVHTESTGKGALDYLMNERNIDTISLLVLDRILPDMDGLEILKKLEERFPNQIPVLILTVLSAEKDVVSGLSQGAVDYIAKPFSLNILLRKVDALLDLYE